jgi:hypothetical protein
MKLGVKILNLLNEDMLQRHVGWGSFVIGSRRACNIGNYSRLKRRRSITSSGIGSSVCSIARQKRAICPKWRQLVPWIGFLQERAPEEPKGKRLQKAWARLNFAGGTSKELPAIP